MEGFHHHLAAEFPELKERIHELKTSDAHFQKLCDRYEVVDKEIARLESRVECGSESEESTLRKERLSLKDQLYAMLQKS